MGSCVRLLPLFLLLPMSAAAAELQSDGAVDFRIGLSRRWDVLVHNRARVRSTSNDWYDVSIIPIFRYQWRPKVQLAAGAFISWFEYPNNDWQRHFRPIVAIEPTVLRKPVTLALRTQYERFMITERPDYNRYRQRFRVSRGRQWSPYASIEFFFTDHGYATTRYGTGLRRNINKRDSVEFGYWYETRRLNDYGIRHMFYTTFIFNFQGFAPDL